MRIMIAAMALLMSATTMMAQTGNDKGKRQEDRKKVEEMYIEYISKQLALDRETNTAFWNLHEAYETKKKGMKKELRKTTRPLEGEALTDENLEDQIQGRKKMEIELISLESSFHTDVLALLGAEKTQVFFKAQKAFKKEILKKIKGGEVRGDRQDRED